MSIAPTRPDVVIAFNAFRPGGSQTYATMLAAMLAEEGLSCVFVGKPGTWRRRLQSTAPTVRVLWREGTAIQPRSRIKKASLQVGEAEATIRLRRRTSSARLVVASQPGPIAFAACHRDIWPAARRVALIHGTTTVEWPVRHHASTVAQLDLLAASTPEAFSVISAAPAPAALLGNLFDAQAFWGVDPETLDSSYDADGPILFVGTLTPNKTPPLRALIGSLASIPSRRLVIVGDGPVRPQLEAAAAHAGVRDRVSFAGSCEDPRPALLQAGVVVGAGRGAIEALSAGRPVVVATADGCHGPARHADLGVLERFNFTGRTPTSTDPSSSPALASAVAEALALARDERHAMARWARRVGTIAPLLDQLATRPS